MRKWQMNRKKAALLLTAAIAVTLCPFTTDVAANNGRYFTIVEIENLPEETARQTVALGSPVEEVEELLPDKLAVMGYWNKEEIEEGETQTKEEEATSASSGSGQTDGAFVPPPPPIPHTSAGTDREI